MLIINKMNDNILKNKAYSKKPMVQHIFYIYVQLNNVWYNSWIDIQCKVVHLKPDLVLTSGKGKKYLLSLIVWFFSYLFQILKSLASLYSTKLTLSRIFLLI